MKTHSTHSDNEARVDLGARAAKDPILADAELSGRAVFTNTSHEDENAVDLNGQDPRRSTPLVERIGLRTDLLGTPNSPLLNGETSASRHPTQNDIVVLAGEGGTWQVVAPVKRSKADIRRREGFDTRVVTAFVRCANSPGVQLLTVALTGRRPRLSLALNDALSGRCPYRLLLPSDPVSLP